MTSYFFVSILYKWFVLHTIPIMLVVYHIFKKTLISHNPKMRNVLNKYNLVQILLMDDQI